MKSGQTKAHIAFAISFLPFLGFVPMFLLTRVPSGWVVAFLLYLLVWTGVWVKFISPDSFPRRKHIVLGVVAALAIQAVIALAFGLWFFRDQYDERPPYHIVEEERVEPAERYSK